MGHQSVSPIVAIAFFNACGTFPKSICPDRRSFIRYAPGAKGEALSHSRTTGIQSSPVILLCVLDLRSGGDGVSTLGAGLMVEMIAMSSLFWQVKY
jgi:hypothetical protein